MSVPWRFEYVDTSYELDYLHPERSEAVVCWWISVVFKVIQFGWGMFKAGSDT